MSYDNPRLDLMMTLPDAIVAFVDGNPGAVRALMECCTKSTKIDPDSAFGTISPLIGLDNLDCYGSRIWMFYKDVCNHNVNAMLGLMRAHQLGFVGTKELNAAIDA